MLLPCMVGGKAVTMNNGKASLSSTEEYKSLEEHVNAHK